MDQKPDKETSKPTHNQGRPRLRLPFEERPRGGWAEWVYVHRVGLLVTVVLYLSAVIAFLSYRIVINSPENGSSTMLVDLVEPEKPIAEPEQPKTPEQLQDVEYEKVMNRLSNENAKEESRSQRRNTMSEAEREARRVNDMLAQGKDNYQRGLNEVDAIANARSSRRTDTENKADRDQGKIKPRDHVKGNVVVSYDLPGRNDTYLHIPAYECEGGGRVVVAVTVNQSGRVVSASIDKTTGSSDNCILEMALRAARGSSFNASQAAPERQRGTITYIFVPQ